MGKSLCNINSDRLLYIISRRRHLFCTGNLAMGTFARRGIYFLDKQKHSFEVHTVESQLKSNYIIRQVSD